MKYSIKLASPPASSMEVFLKLKNNGYEAFFVGGCVRDRILGRDVSDWDIATNATPYQVVALFDHVVETGIQHGTVTVVEDGGHYEVTTYRVDGAYSDGRRPDTVTFSPNIQDDLSRRDFTINAMAWDPLKKILIDPFGGQTDLARGLIRTVGTPGDRFKEDGLRAMRAIRFAAVLGFEIDPQTESAIPLCLDTFKQVSFERIRDELVKIFASPKPGVGIRLLNETKLLYFLPHRLCSFERFSYCPRRLHLQLATFAYLFGQDPRELMNKLKFPLELTDRVVRIFSTIDNSFRFSEDASEYRRIVSKVGRDIVVDVFDFHENVVFDGTSAYWAILRDAIHHLNILQDPLTISELAVNGDDIIETLGLKSGRQVGETLQRLLEKVWEDPSLNTKTQLLGLLPLPQEV